MAGLANKNVKFAKGDSLDAIAHKYGVKSDRIWKLPDNKKIASTRGKPENLKPGDPLVIPPSDKDLQVAEKALDADLAVVEAELERIKKRVAVLDKAEKEIKASVAEVTKELQAQIAKINNVSNAADLAATVVSLGRVVSGAMKKGVAATAKHGEELAKHNHEIQKDAIKLAYSPFKDVSVKVISNSQASSDSAVLFVQTAVSSFDKMTSPSFWSNTAYQLASGKSWSDAVNTKVTDELQERLDEVQKLEKVQLAKLQHMRQALVAPEAHLNAAVKQLQSLKKGLG